MHNNRHLDGHKVSVNLLKGGVYAKETHHSIVRIAPALTIEAWQIDEIVRIPWFESPLLLGNTKKDPEKSLFLKKVISLT